MAVAAVAVVAVVAVGVSVDGLVNGNVIGEVLVHALVSVFADGPGNEAVNVVAAGVAGVVVVSDASWCQDPGVAVVEAIPLPLVSVAAGLQPDIGWTGESVNTCWPRTRLSGSADGDLCEADSGGQNDARLGHAGGTTQEPVSGENAGPRIRPTKIARVTESRTVEKVCRVDGGGRWQAVREWLDVSCCTQESCRKQEWSCRGGVIGRNWRCGETGGSFGRRAPTKPW
jgi:hypothetical protein